MKTKHKAIPIPNWIDLQCLECFRTDKMGLTETALGQLVVSGEWTNVQLGEEPPKKFTGREDDDWRADEFICWGTHIGLCDRCQKESLASTPATQKTLFA